MTDTSSTTSPTDHAEADHPAMGHVMPVPVLLGVFVTLLVLTFVTVAVTWIDLGPWNLWAAMAIATVKASLVALYFMHLRYDHPFNAVIFLAALVFLALFLSLTLLDTHEYQHEIERFVQEQS